MTRELYAVLTGTMIRAPVLATKTEEDNDRYLKNVLDDIGRTYALPFSRFGTEKFLGVSKKPEDALLDALIIRLKLRSFPDSGKKSEQPDARITIGIGTIDHFSRYSAIGEGSGEAFRNAGLFHDEVPDMPCHLVITTSWPEFNDIFAIECRIVDALFGRLTKKQDEIARMYHLSQSAVSYRLRDTEYDLLKMLVARFREQILNKKEYFSGMDDKNDEAKKYFNTALSFSREMRYREARTYFTKSMECYQETGNHMEETRTLLHIGMMNEKTLQFGDALSCYTKSQMMAGNP